MVDKSDRNWRWIMRRITRYSLFYTEMISAPAIVHGDRKKLLDFDPSEKPLVLQLGWDEAPLLAEACRIASDWNYDEINLNCGCPSVKVQHHGFGACLMGNPDNTARLIDAMASASSLPITVKQRIGIRSRKDGISLESYEHLSRFVQTMADSGCRKFIVHARIADLDGLSPKENRNIPPLRPEDVYRLKQSFPHLFIEINGGYRSLSSIDDALENVDAVMLGRLALDDPWTLAEVDSRCFDAADTGISRRELLDAAIPYMARRVEEGASRSAILQAIMNLFAGRKGAKAWKRAMTAIVADRRENFASSMDNAVKCVDSALLDERAGTAPALF